MCSPYHQPLVQFFPLSIIMLAFGQWVSFCCLLKLSSGFFEGTSDSIFPYGISYTLYFHSATTAILWFNFFRAPPSPGNVTACPMQGINVLKVSMKWGWIGIWGWLGSSWVRIRALSEWGSVCWILSRSWWDRGPNASLSGPERIRVRECVTVNLGCCPCTCGDGEEGATCGVAQGLGSRVLRATEGMCWMWCHWAGLLCTEPSRDLWLCP